MVRLRTGETDICFDFSFFLVVGLFLAFDRFGYGAICLAACICHEAGHLIVMLISGKKPKEIFFSGGGICIRGRGEQSAPVLAAGCTVNFLLFGIFFFATGKGDLYSTLFGIANLAVGIFNLLPIGALDGKQLLKKAALRFMSFETGEGLIRYTETIFTAAAVVGVIILLLSGLVNATAVVVLAYVFVLDFVLS